MYSRGYIGRFCVRNTFNLKQKRYQLKLNGTAKCYYINVSKVWYQGTMLLY